MAKSKIGQLVAKSNRIPASAPRKMEGERMRQWLNRPASAKHVGWKDWGSENLPARKSTESQRRQKVEKAVHLERVSNQVHKAWMEGKRKSGITSRKSEAGEEMMRPYSKLSHEVKDQDRQTVKAVWRAEKAAKSSGGTREYHRDERGRFARKGS